MLDKYSPIQAYCLRQFGLEDFLSGVGNADIPKLTEVTDSAQVKRNIGERLELFNTDKTTSSAEKLKNVASSSNKKSVKKTIAMTSGVKQFIVLINLESLEELKYGKQLIDDMLKLLQVDLDKIQAISFNGDWHQQLKQSLETKKNSVVLPQTPEMGEELEAVLSDKECMPTILPSLNELLSTAVSKQEAMQKLLPFLKPYESN